MRTNRGIYRRHPQSLAGAALGRSGDRLQVIADRLARPIRTRVTAASTVSPAANVWARSRIPVERSQSIRGRALFGAQGPAAEPVEPKWVRAVAAPVTVDSAIAFEGPERRCLRSLRWPSQSPSTAQKVDVCDRSPHCGLPPALHLVVRYRGFFVPVDAIKRVLSTPPSRFRSWYCAYLEKISIFCCIKHTRRLEMRNYLTFPSKS